MYIGPIDFLIVSDRVFHSECIKEELAVMFPSYKCLDITWEEVWDFTYAQKEYSFRRDLGLPHIIFLLPDIDVDWRFILKNIRAHPDINHSILIALSWGNNNTTAFSEGLNGEIFSCGKHIGNDFGEVVAFWTGGSTFQA